MSVAAGTLPSPSGSLSVVKTYDVQKYRAQYVQNDVTGHFRPERAGLLLRNKKLVVPTQQKILAFLRDNVHKDLPRKWRELVLGHDSHISISAALYMKHFHATWRDPFTGKMGWWEDVGLVSRNKVTTAFRDNIVDNLVTDTTAFGDYKFHEVGTSNQAEANTDTALITTTGIARVAGTQVEASANVYRSVATITADATEVWQEHGIFNIVTAGVLMDRSLVSPTASVVASDNVQFTYEITFNAEA
jgi:hypothetical protein